MNSKPTSNIVPFPTDDRKKRVADGDEVVQDSLDRGPSPEESLRMMRAFVAIKNRTVRENLIVMLEGASRKRDKAPGSASE